MGKANLQHCPNLSKGAHGHTFEDVSGFTWGLEAQVKQWMGVTWRALVTVVSYWFTEIKAEPTYEAVQ